VYSESEVVSLVLGLAMIPVLIASRPDVASRFTNYFVVGYVFMLASNIFTIAEGYYAPELLNVLEHASLACASLIFAAAFVMRRREMEQDMLMDT